MHKTVLLNEAIEWLDLNDGEVVFDGTFGLGGHTRKILESNGSVKVVASDLDSDSLEFAEKISAEFGERFVFVQDSFINIAKVLEQEKINGVDKVLLDLGWNSRQFEQSGRGFSFQVNEPLIMSLKKELSDEDLTAREIVNTWEEKSLADIFYGFGEERYAKKIAGFIVENRQYKAIETTQELVDIIYRAVPKAYRFGKIHPATRTFQALRIAVNKELQVLEIGLRELWKVIKPGGRIVIISFHSLEDRIVKNFGKEIKKSGEGQSLSKKPVLPSEEELLANPRSRSAKMRIIYKNNQNQNNE